MSRTRDDTGDEGPERGADERAVPDHPGAPTSYAEKGVKVH